jgi:hypothetical protein
MVQEGVETGLRKPASVTYITREMAETAPVSAGHAAEGVLCGVRIEWIHGLQFARKHYGVPDYTTAAAASN